MAPRYVESVDQVQRVVSKSEALAQCGKWLDEHGLSEEKQSIEDSTGAAAARVSKIKPITNTKIAAIAPRAAAKAYDLKILARDVQDDPKNTTTFLLLQNTAVPEKCVVGIIGINGKFGQVLKAFFENLGLIVIGSDRKIPTNLTNAQVVKKADVIVFAVAVKRTAETISSVMKYTREDQLLMDITSVKQPAISAMLKGKAQVVGLHPMFAPSVSFDGQTIVVCPARLTEPRWKTWLVNMLAATGSVCKWSTAEEHDRFMVTVQVSSQSANFVSALLVTLTGVDVSESLTFTSPYYKLMFSLMGRLLTQDPGLYGSIFMQNPGSVKMLKKRIEIEKTLIDIIERKDDKAFAALFLKAQKHFGSGIVRSANELFTRLNAVMKTIEGDRSVILEFASRDSRPGLLEKVSRVFTSNGVNLTGINSVQIDKDHIQFSITTEQSKDSSDVIKSLRTIEKWVKPKIRVVV